MWVWQHVPSIWEIRSRTKYDFKLRVNLIYQHFKYKLRDLNQNWLALIKLREYADAVHE